MSTATNNANAAAVAGRSQSAFWRFVWKEFRMVRGLWLAVAVLAVLFLFGLTIVPPGTYFATGMLVIAYSAAALYTAGAAATSFSVEHEEETYDFLVRLPATWLPMFAGKLLVIGVSAVALAASLALLGWAMCGLRTVPDAGTVFGVVGVAILEAFAWGTFFSLIIKRPLIAAVVTLIVAAVVTNIAVNLSSPHSIAGDNANAYAHAVPLRLAIVVAVFACSTLVARRWLVTGARPPAVLKQTARNQSRLRLSLLWIRLSQPATFPHRGSRRRMMSRLLWQTWRESWKLLLLPLGVGVLLLIGVGAAVGLTVTNDEKAFVIFLLTPLFVPTLYGAMAFYADQRRDNYRFLAEHAARPRYVWLARHIVWLGTLAAICLLVTYFLMTWLGIALRNDTQFSLEEYVTYGNTLHASNPYILYDHARFSSDAIRIASLAALGGLAAYGVGQFCSMVIRSEIMAAFAALTLSAVVSAWVAVLYAWNLSGWLFLFPLFAGFMFATWLRAPDWIAGRNSLRAWLKPLLAITAPILLVGFSLPGSRLAQVQTVFVHGYVSRGVAIPAGQAMGNELRYFESSFASEARETAQMYINAAERLATGPVPNLLEPWEKPEYAAETSVIVGGIDIDVAKIPPDQLDAFQQARKKQREVVLQNENAAIDAAIEASKRPTCHFDFELPLLEINLADIVNRHSNLVRNYALYEKLDNLLNRIIFDGNPSLRGTPKAFDRLLAGLRMSEHLRSGQPYMVFTHQLEKERDILEAIGEWAGGNRTKDELQAALDKLDFRFRPNLQEPLLADHLLIREALQKSEASLVLARSPIGLYNFLAYMANQLPWERERALTALNRITIRNLGNSAAFADKIANQLVLAGGAEATGTADPLRQWIRPQYNLPESWVIQEPAAHTSYLVSLEYRARVSMTELWRVYADNETCRRAALVRIGLAMYRLEHKEYPRRLTDLVPNYLKALPIDPYSNQSFQYVPSGLDRPLEFSDSPSKRIDARTPLFWSVGANNVRLGTQLSRTVQDEIATAGSPENDNPQITDYVHRFVVSEYGGWSSDPLVFPLPK